MHTPNTKWLDSLRHYTVKYTPDLTAAQIIYKIARGSPAEALGLSPGDALLSVNGVAAAGLDIDDILLKASIVIYRVYSPSHKTIADIRMSCIPLGVRFLASATAILAHARRHGYDGPSGFYALWEQEDYDNILMLSRIVASKTPVGLLCVLLGASKSEPIAKFMKAVCEYERKSNIAASDDIRKFVEQHAKDYAGDVQALGYYYLARLARDDADLLYYQEYMRQAYELNPASERILRGAHLAKINVNKSHPMLGRMLPLHYKFKLLNTKGKVQSEIDLPALISHLREAQVIPICFMANCRANLAYNQAIKTYRTMHDCIGNSLAPMVVITNMTKQKSDLSLWYKQERLALKNGLPITVLSERDGNFISDLELKGAPVFWAVNQTGRVVWTDGLSDAYDYWSLLYAINGSTGAQNIHTSGTGTFG